MNTNKRFQRIVFSQDNYDNDRDKLFEVIKNFLRILLDSGHVAVIRYDEPGLGIVVIDFEHDECFDAWGIANPVWITEDEEIYLANRNEVCCEESLDGGF